MKLPRDLSADALLKALVRFGYRVARQTGSHVRVVCDEPATHAVTVPNHSPLKVGTLAAILGDVADHHGIAKSELIRLLFHS